MSKQRIRELDIPDGRTLPVVEVDFEVVREEWNEYTLSDGTKLRVKNVVTRIIVQVDENGEVVYNENGEPNVVINGKNNLVAIAAES
jgi:hypothetical protein